MLHRQITAAIPLSVPFHSPLLSCPILLSAAPIPLSPPSRTPSRNLYTFPLKLIYISFDRYIHLAREVYTFCGKPFTGGMTNYLRAAPNARKSGRGRSICATPSRRLLSVSTMYDNASNVRYSELYALCML